MTLGTEAKNLKFFECIQLVKARKIILNWNPQPKTSVSLFVCSFPKIGEKRLFEIFENEVKRLWLQPSEVTK